jgi:hypothetical protein
MKARILQMHNDYYSRLAEDIETKEDAWRLSTYTMRMAMVNALEKIHRVEVSEDGLTVVCLGLNVTPHDGTYSRIEDLPEWMQQKLHVLTMMDYKPPTKTVEGIGRRISRDVFWVVEDF